MSKLCCTFLKKDEWEFGVSNLINKYPIDGRLMFVLDFESNEEIIVTYSLDNNNLQNIPKQTILIHRNKSTNTLYTINSLNNLIKTLNNGEININYIVNWNDYLNSILLHNKSKVGFSINPTKILKKIHL